MSREMWVDLGGGQLFLPMSDGGAWIIPISTGVHVQVHREAFNVVTTARNARAARAWVAQHATGHRPPPRRHATWWRHR